MEPTTLIVVGLVIGIVFFAVLLLAPKIREFNAQIAREEADLQALVGRKGWRIEKPAQGDIKWVIHTPQWQLAYDTDFSSENSRPHLQWYAQTPDGAKSRFAILTEPGLKMMRHPFARKAALKLLDWAKKIPVKSNPLPANLPVPPRAPDTFEIFTLLDAKCDCPIGETKYQKLHLVANSQTALQKFRNSALPRLLNQLAQHESSRVNDNSERLAQFSTRIEIKTYTNRPTADLVKSIVELGEQTLALKL